MIEPELPADQTEEFDFLKESESIPADVPFSVKQTDSIATPAIPKKASKRNVDSASSASTVSFVSKEPMSGQNRRASASVRAIPVLAGYAVVVTLVLGYCLLSGRLTLTPQHPLESLPDLRPLNANEFLRVPEDASLPPGHVLRLGESRRFGDIVVTPIRVTRDPLAFQGFLTGRSEESLTTGPVLKLWLNFKNVSTCCGFPPLDVGLMSHRSPPLTAESSAMANSYLTVRAGGGPPVQVLNYLQTMDDNFVITGQNSGQVIMPEEVQETFVACDDQITAIPGSTDNVYSWRVQFRKGIHPASGHGVTTLVDVQFGQADISSPDKPPVAL